MKRIRFYSALAGVFIKRNRKKLSYGFIVLLILGFVFSIVLPSSLPKLDATAEEFQKETFVEGVVGVPTHPNPIFDTNETQKDISTLVYRSLTKLNSDGSLQPDLAESFERVSDTEYIFKLKKDIYWHDGQSFKADDVVYTIRTVQDQQFDSPISSNFKDVIAEMVDDYTVKFKLDEPFSPFPFATTVGIIPEHIPLKNFKPLGTGKFEVKKIDSEEILLSSEKINLLFKFYKTIDEAKTALKLGEIHSLGGLSPQEAQDFEAFGNKTVYSKPLAFRQLVVFFNTRHEILREKDFRQALAYLIDKDKLLSTVDGGKTVIATSQLSLSNWIGKQKELYLPSKKEATENLRDLGFKLEEGAWKQNNQTVKLKITNVDDPELNLVVSQLKQVWSEFGIQIEIESIDVETLRNEVLPNRQFDVLVDFQKISPDPDQYVLWHTTQENNANITGIKSAKLDKILEDARRITDQGKRKEKYQLFTSLLLDEVPAVFLYYPSYYWVVSQKVTGIDLTDFSISSDRFNSSPNWSIQSRIF